MCLHPALVQALTRDRVAGLRHAAEPSVRPRCDGPGASVLLATRRATGWMLVDVGLRLALPQRALNHPTARAQR
jgi:hypothetical protein